MKLLSTYCLTTSCSAAYEIPQGSAYSSIKWTARSRKHDCSMIIVPITKAQLAIIAPKKVTTDQWKAYWGVNQVERLQRTLESLLVAYGGAWAAWFLSFMMGKFVSTFLGCGLIFNWMFTPYVVSSTSNKSLWYKDGKLMHHALFKGTIVSLKKIRRRSGKTIGTVSQTYLDMLVVDELNREMEIITGWKDDYSLLRKGMSLETMLASPMNTYTTIAATSDAYIPALNIWVGEYPYLDKKEYVRLRRSVWDRVGARSGDLNVDEEEDNRTGYRPSASGDLPVSRRPASRTSMSTGSSSSSSRIGKTIGPDYSERSYDHSVRSARREDRRRPGPPAVIDAEEVDEESEEIIYPSSQWLRSDSEET